MKIINNITDKLSDELKEKLEPGSKLSIAAACFSVYAFEELKTQLEGIDALRFIFTSPTFLAEQPEKAQREFYIPRLNREKRCMEANLKYGSAMSSHKKPSPVSARSGYGEKRHLNPT